MANYVLVIEKITDEDNWSSKEKYTITEEEHEKIIDILSCSSNRDQKEIKK